MAQRCATHFLGSLYRFSDIATEELLSTFRAKAAGDVSCKFHDGTFTISCLRNDNTSLYQFVKLVGDFIATESEKEADVFEASNVTRVKGTQSTFATDSAIMTATTSPASTRTPSDGLLIEHHHISRVWSSQRSDDSTVPRLNAAVLSKIESLCRCQIETDSSGDLNIRADTEADIGRAIAKLSIMEQVTSNFPWIYSFATTEGENSIMFQMIALKDLKARDPNDRRHGTTLFSRSSPLIDSLQDLLVIMILRGSKHVPVKQTRLQPEDVIGLPALTQNNQIVSQDVQPLSATSTGTGNQIVANPTSHWVDESTKTSLFLDPFKQASKAEEPSSVAEMTYKEPVGLKKAPIKRARVAKGMVKMKPTVEVPAPQTLQVSAEVQIDADRDNAFQQETTTVRSVPYKNDNSIEHENAAPTRHSANESVQPSSCKENQSSPSLTTSPMLPPEILPEPSEGLRSSISSTHSTPYIAELGWQTVRRGQAGRLVDTSIPDKLDTRKTMSQKAPQGPRSGVSALMRQYEGAAKRMLAPATFHPGLVEFEVKIGRIFLNPNTGSNEFKKRQFGIPEWTSAFPSGPNINTSRIETVFTPRLTTSRSDASSISKLLLPHARPVFGQAQATRKELYVITCKARDSERVLIKVHKDGKFDVHGSATLIGAVEWFFPKRSFDGRLSLISHDAPDLHQYYQAQAVVANLKITPSSNFTSLDVSIKTIDQDVTIESIMLQREATHTAILHPDLSLHLNEVNDLHLSPLENGVHGAITSSNDMIKQDRLWWEASITSTLAESTFKENEILEMGEKATWDPELFIEKGIVRDLYNLTEEVVTRIDHVGFDNKGLKASSGSKSTKYQKSIQNPPTISDVPYW